MKTSSRGKLASHSKQKKKNEESNLLFRASPLPMWIYDAETFRFLDVNEAAVAFYGYSRQEFLSMQLPDILAEIEVSSGARQARTIHKRGSKISGEMSHCRKNGSSIIVEVTNQKWMFDGREAVLAVMQDVTSHKHANENTQGYSAEFHSLVANAMDAIILVDENQRITFFNPTAEKMFRWTTSEVSGKPLGMLIPERFRSDHTGYADDYIKSGSTKRVPGHLRRFMALRADGTEFPAEIAISSTEIAGKKHFAAILRDMTEQQQTEDELRRAERNYRALVEQLPMMVYRNSASDITLTTYISPQIKSILGYTPKEWIADPKFWEKALHPQDHDRVMAEVQRVHQNSQPFDIEYRIVAGDGHTVWFRDQAALIYDSEGYPLFWQGLMVDITKSKTAQETLSESEDRYRDLVESSRVLICTHDLQGKILSVNPWAAHVGGYEERDLIGRNIQNILAPEERDGFYKYIAAIRKNGFSSGLMTVVTASGEKRIWEFHNTLRTEGVAEPIVRGTAFDITERRMAEEALRESEERFRTLYENTAIGLYRTTPDGCILMSNPALVKMLGYESFEELSQRNLENGENNATYLRRDFKERIEREGQVQGLEAEWRTKQGKSIYVRESARAVRDENGNILYYEGTVEDITERRRAEIEIRESENRYRQLFNESPICIWEEDFTEVKQYLENLRTKGVVDLEKHFNLHPEEIQHCASLIKVLDVNQASLPIYEAEKKEDLLENNVANLLCEDAWPYFKQELIAISNGAKAYEGETVGLTLKGKKNAFYLKWVEIPSGQNSRSRMLITFVDISERKRAEETLRFSENMYRGLFNTVLDGIFRAALDGRILSVNPALIRMLGYQTEKQLLALNMRDLYLHPETRGNNLAQLNETGEVRDRELELQCADGTTLVVLENSRAIRDSNNELLFYEGTLTDITERKRAEEALRASEAELQALLDAIPDVILVLDKHGRYLKIAPTDPNLSYMPAEDLLGKRLHDIFSRQKADEFVKHIQEALQTHKPVRFQYAMLVHDRIVWFSGATAPLTEDTVVWVARDITSQKEAEQQIQRRLDELEALYESGLALSQILDPKEIGGKIVQILSDRLNWHHAAVRVRSEDSGEVELLAFSPSDQPHDQTESDYAVAGRAANVNEGISGWVIKNGRTVNSPDLEKDPRYDPTFAGMRSGLYIPIWAGGRVLGCISVESSQRKAFQEEDERFLTTLASQAATALENARLFESERQRRLDAETLQKAASVLTSSLNKDQILASLLDGLAQIIPFGITVVFIADGDRITAVAERGSLPTKKITGQSFPLKGSMQEYLHETRTPLILTEAQKDSRFSQWDDKVIIHGWMGVPLIVREEIVGYLTMGSSDPNIFTESHAEMALAFASHAAAALENARLFDAEQRRRLDAETLMQAATAISSSLDLEKILNELLDALANVISISSATVFMQDHERLRAMAAKGLAIPEEVLGHTFPIDDEIFGLILESGRPVILPDVSADQRFKNWGNDQPVFGWMGVPLIVRGQIIGCITFDSLTPNVYTEADSSMAMAIASQAAAAIENSRLYNDALVAAERRSVLHEAGQEISRLGQDLEQLYITIHRSASRLMPAEAFTIALWDKDRSEMDDVYLFDRMGRSPNVRVSFGQGFSSKVITSGETIMINDDLVMDVEAVHFGSEAKVRSILATPMRVNAKIIGVISVQSYAPNIYSNEDRLLLEMLASQAAVAIENARLYEQGNRRIKQLESLNRASRVLTGTLELKSLLESILRVASQAIPGAEKGTILLREHGHDHLHVRAQIGYEDSRLTELPFDDDKGYSGQAYHENRPILIRDSIAEYEIPFDRQISEVNAVQSAVAAPLIVRNEPIGVIALDNASQKNAFNEQDLDLLTIFASSAAQVIENSRLFEQTRRRANEFEALYETAADLASQTDLQTLLNAIIERAWTLSGAAGAGLYLFDPGRGDLELVAINDPAVHPGIRLALGEGLSGRVAQTKKPMAVNDYQTWENCSTKYEGIPYTSIIAVPMLYSGELIGVLDIYNRAEKDTNEPPTGFNEQDANLIYLFANAVAGAVYSTRLLDQTRQRLNELDALSRVSSALRIASTRAEMAPIILSQLREILNADGAIFITINPITNELVDELAEGSLEFFTGFAIPTGQGITTQVIQSRQVYSTSNLQDNPRVFAKDRMPFVRSAVIVPLVSQDSSLGALWITRDEKDGIPPAPFADNEISLLVAIGDMAANAIQRAKLHEETTVYNEQLIIVNRLGRMLAETLDLSVIYQHLAQFSLDLLSDTTIIYITEFDEQKHLLHAVHGIQDGEILNVSQMPGILLSENEHGALNRVILTGEPMIVNDLSEFFASLQVTPVLVGKPDRKTESAIYIPMISEGKVIGILQAQSYLNNRYTPSDAKLLSLVANTAAIAIQNSRLFAQLKRRLDQLSALHTIDTAINSTTDLRLSLQSVLENVTQQLKVDAACILLLNPSTLVLQYAAGVGFSTLDITSTSLALGRGIAGKAALERQTINIPDLATEDTGLDNHRLAAMEKFIGYCAVPLVAKGEVKGVMELFHRTRLDLDDERISFMDMLANQAALAVDNALLFENLERANIELTIAYDATIEGWSQALELRDQETQGHSARVMELTLHLGVALGLSDKDLHEIRRGVLLHDIGKMGIPDSILHKPGTLTDEEWTTMRKHPQYAYDMLSPIAYLRSALDIPYCHHEKWDGTGYPRGIKGETIPLAARMFAIADVYDALTNDRPYRKAWPKEKTIAYIHGESGKHFDPNIVSIFLKLLQE